MDYYENTADVLTFLEKQGEQAKHFRGGAASHYKLTLFIKMRTAADLVDKSKRAEKLQEYEGVLGQQQTEFDVLDEVKADLGLKLKLWQGIKEWNGLVSEWTDTPLQDVQAAVLEKKIAAFNKLVFLSLIHI